MAAERLIRLAGRAVRHVYFTIAGAAADQQTRFVAGILQKAYVPDRAIVHAQFDFLSCRMNENQSVNNISQS